MNEFNLKRNKKKDLTKNWYKFFFPLSKEKCIPDSNRKENQCIVKLESVGL